MATKEIKQVIDDTINEYSKELREISLKVSSLYFFFVVYAFN